MLRPAQGHSHGEQHVVEDVALASQIEALPGRAGFFKFESSLIWNQVESSRLRSLNLVYIKKIVASRLVEAKL